MFCPSDVAQGSGSGGRRATFGMIEDENDAVESLSQKAKVAVGRWGEEYALRCLREDYRKRFPHNELRLTSAGFVISHEGMNLVEGVWLNHTTDCATGHDIFVVVDGVREYFEVKSTTTEAKAVMDLSGPQWRLATIEESRFHILRVYNAGTPQARMMPIDDPVKQWKEGAIRVSSLRLTI